MVYSQLRSYVNEHSLLEKFQSGFQCIILKTIIIITMLYFVGWGMLAGTPLYDGVQYLLMVL